MRLGRVREVPTETDANLEVAPTAAELRQLGDSCRDRGLWLEGTCHYGRYLELNPNDAAIWVQLGHCLKESGAHSEAEKAYDRAIAIGGEDHDILLHKGHLAKLMGSTGDAVYCYKRSLALRQNHNDALKELLALGALDSVREILPAYRAPRTRRIPSNNIPGYHRSHRIWQTKRVAKRHPARSKQHCQVCHSLSTAPKHF